MRDRGRQPIGRPRPHRGLALLLVAALAAPAAGQTPIEPPKNRFTPEEDVQLGREAAAEVRKEYPVIEDAAIRQYLDRLGNRLVEAAPASLDQPVFEYSFTAVNLKEINAFALPGGPMFVNRGMVEAARTESEVVGVMAHELAHVLLRHGTANATKAQGFQLGALAGAIAGAVVGGGWGRVISQGSQFGLGAWFLKYSREYERQADLLGVQLMARAGYDPNALARMFETIEREGGGRGGPEWLSSHPNPGNRSEAIAREAALVDVRGRRDNGAEFARIRDRFASLPPARSMSDTARNRGPAPAANGRPGENVPPPATTFRSVTGGNLFRAAVPQNWQAMPADSSVKFVPPNAYGEVSGQPIFTHGVEFGVARATSSDLSASTRSLVNALAQSNPDLRAVGGTRRVTLAQRAGLSQQLVNQSITGSRETIGLYTTMLRDGNLFYVLTVVPSAEERQYRQAFARVAQSVRLNGN